MPAIYFFLTLPAQILFLAMPQSGQNSCLWLFHAPYKKIIGRWLWCTVFPLCSSWIYTWQIHAMYKNIRYRAVYNKLPVAMATSYKCTMRSAQKSILLCHCLHVHATCKDEITEYTLCEYVTCSKTYTDITIMSTKWAKNTVIMVFRTNMNNNTSTE